MNCQELNTKFQLFCTEEEALKKTIEDLKVKMPDDQTLNIDEMKLSADLINAKMNDLVQGTNTAQKVEEHNAITLRSKDLAVLDKVKIDRALAEAEQALQIVTDHKFKAYKALDEGIKTEARRKMDEYRNKLSNQIDEIGDTLADLMAMEGVVGYQNAYHRMMSGFISGCPFPDESRKLDSYRQQVTDRLTLFKQSVVKEGGNNE